MLLTPAVHAERRLPPADFERHYQAKYARPVRKALQFIGSEGVRATLRKARSKRIERAIEAAQQIVIAVVEHDGREYLGFTRDLGGPLRFDSRLMFNVSGNAHDAILNAIELSPAALAQMEAYLPVPSCPVRPQLVAALAACTGLTAAEFALTDDVSAPPAAPRPARTRTDRGRVWLIGCGGYAREQILPEFRDDVAAAVDYRAGLIQQHAGCEFPVHDALETVLDDIAGTEKPLVIVSTYHSDHVPVAEAILDARPDARVFLEKPPCVSRAEAERLTELRDAGAWIDIGYNRRHAPFTRLIRDELKSLPGPRVMTADVKELKLPQSHWYFWPNQGTRVTGNACHWIDLLCHLMHGVPAEVTTAGDDASVVLTLAFADGSLGSIVASELGDDLAGVTERIQVRAGSATLTTDEFRTLEVVRDGVRNVTRRRHRDKGHAAMYRDLRKRWLTDATPAYPVDDIVRVATLVEDAARHIAHHAAAEPVPA